MPLYDSTTYSTRGLQSRPHRAGNGGKEMPEHVVFAAMLRELAEGARRGAGTSPSAPEEQGAEQPPTISGGPSADPARLGSPGGPPASTAVPRIAHVPAPPEPPGPPDYSSLRIPDREAPQRNERLERTFSILQGLGGAAQAIGGLTGSDTLAAVGQGAATGAGNVLAEDRARFLDAQEAFRDFLETQQRYHRQLEMEELRAHDRRARDVYQRDLEEYRHERGLGEREATREQERVEAERKAASTRLESRIKDFEAAGEFGDAYQRALVEARGYAPEEARAVAEGKRAVWEVEQQRRRRQASGGGRSSGGGRGGGSQEPEPEPFNPLDRIPVGELGKLLAPLRKKVREGKATFDDLKQIAILEEAIITSASRQQAPPARGRAEQQATDDLTAGERERLRSERPDLYRAIYGELDTAVMLDVAAMRTYLSTTRYSPEARSEVAQMLLTHLDAGRLTDEQAARIMDELGLE